MAYVQIKEPVTDQVVLAFVSQGLKETVVKVEIIVMLDSVKDFGDFLKYPNQVQGFLKFFNQSFQARHALVLKGHGSRVKLHALDLASVIPQLEHVSAMKAIRALIVLVTFTT